MKNDTARHRILKISLNQEEEDAIRRKCAAVGRTMSAAGRELLNSWIPGLNRNGQSRRREWPDMGPVLRMPPMNRRGGAVPRLRL
jgi:hypothetical protein